MKKILLILTLVFVFSSTNIYAARFGSGKSFGQRSSQHQSSSSNQQHQRQAQQQPHQPQPNPPTPPKRSFMSKLFPVLAGLSVGALLGSLLSGHGLGGGLGAMLMMLVGAVIVFAIIRKLMARKTEEKRSDNYNFQTSTASAAQPFTSQPVESYQQPQTQSATYPTTDGNIGSYAFNHTSDNHFSDFNKDEFLRNAKITFIRMQNAYDHKNMIDIRNFTTPEVFAEIQMQLQERGNEASHTEVVNIHAALLNAPDDHNPAASVLFSGQIKEQQNTSAINISEIWHFTKNNNNWAISGIEQQS